MSDSVVHKGAAPAQRSAKAQAHRRRQRRLVVSTLTVIVLGVAAWQVWAYLNNVTPRAEAMVQEGIAYMTPGHYEEAIPYFDQALSLVPKLADAYYQRATARLNLGQRDAAAADFRAALEAKPTMVEASVALSDIYIQTGDRQRAISELTRTIGLKPTVEAYYRRGTAYSELDQHREAIADFTWVIEQVRDAPYMYLARARSKRAIGDLDSAKQDEEIAAGFIRPGQ